uniref:Uncharacterized protein n=1 Tax=Schistosoma japonicum TaxID=6182 RepID=Q5BY65_SCHJA|nr:unknown [Schistosoma japonicum]
MSMKNPFGDDQIDMFEDHTHRQRQQPRRKQIAHLDREIVLH